VIFAEENLLDTTDAAQEQILPIEQRLEAELAKGLLRFSTAGSVDDGSLR